MFAFNWLLNFLRYENDACPLSPDDLHHYKTPQEICSFPPLTMVLEDGEEEEEKLSVISLNKKMKVPMKDFFSKCDQIRKKLRIWSHLLKKSLIFTKMILVSTFFADGFVMEGHLI